MQNGVPRRAELPFLVLRQNVGDDLTRWRDTAAAQLTLQDIENNGVIFEFSATRMPLARAMDNLRLAESELKNNHPDQAKAALAVC